MSGKAAMVVKRTRRALACARYRLSGSADPPIIVYQMGRIGSTTVYQGLLDLPLDVPIYHVDTLCDFEQRREWIKAKYEDPTALLRGVEQGEKLRRRMAERPQQRWNLVSMVRDPIAQSVSHFFQNLEGLLPDVRRRWRAGEISVDALIDLFLEEGEPRDFLNWFNREMQRVSAIDVFSRPFPVV